MSDNVAKLASRESIAPGTIVRLKSGGPDMTVVERTTNYVFTMWAKDDGSDVHTYTFPTSAIEVKK